EVAGLHTGRRDKLEHTGAGAVLAASVHTLEQNDDRVGRVGVKQMLQFADALAKFAGLLARLVLFQTAASVRIEIAQADSGSDSDRLRHGRIIRHSPNQSSRSIFAAMTKSLSVKPSILCVQIVIFTRPQAR